MSRLAAFIYLLGRDYLPLGKIEEIMEHIDQPDDKDFVASSKALEVFAMDIANRLRQSRFE